MQCEDARKGRTEGVREDVGLNDALHLKITFKDIIHNSDSDGDLIFMGKVKIILMTFLCGRFSTSLQ